MLSTISDTSKRVKEMAQMHKPLFAGELFFTEMYGSGSIPISALCRKETLQGFGFRENVRKEL
jgi:hypothetical protein